MTSLIKKAFPAPFKTWLRTAHQDRTFVRLVQRLGDGSVPEAQDLARLSGAWGNDGYSADVEYLSKVCAFAAVTPGPVLECGSGLTTILLSMLAGRRGVRVYSLEHIAEWKNRLERMLNRCNLRASIELCRLRPYDGFDWYELPPALPGDFRLVICDGPPGATRGGRFGLLPVCASRLHEDCTILLDDAERVEEQAVMERWRQEFCAVTSIVETGSGAFAEIKPHQPGNHAKPPE
jgi:Methyltransferase domain